MQQRFGNTAPMAEVLWQWSLLVHRCQRPRQNKQIFRMGQELLTSSLAFISNQLSKWSLDKDEPSTAVLLELQKKGRRMHSGLLARLLRKKNKNAAAKSWMEDGLKVRPRIDLFEDARSAIFLGGLKDMPANEHLLVICHP